MQLEREQTLFGHPTGLYTLFFAEMWERFSYYGMRALLVLYMGKGFLHFSDGDAYTVYGAYTALVYMTPFFGGMLADRLFGQRNAVILGGLLMAAGHLMMTIELKWAFFLALGLLIAGNGFFKPNISTIVGKLYRQGDPRRDGGFTIFYIGINLGAGLAPLLCGYIGERYGWHFGFGLATLGMLIGLSVFWAPDKLAQALIMLGAVATATSMVYFPRGEDWVLLSVYVVFAVILVIAGIVSVKALARGGLPRDAGVEPAPVAMPGVDVLSRRRRHKQLALAGTALAVPLFALLVWGGLGTSVIPDDTIENLRAQGSMGNVAATFLSEASKPAGLVLSLAGIAALIYLLQEAFRLQKVARQRLYVALILMFFSMLFWAFFEQAGSSINNFTDRNVDRVLEKRAVTEADVGTTASLKLTQEQIGYSVGGQLLNMSELDKRRAAATDAKEHGDTVSHPDTVSYTFDQASIGMKIEGTEIPTSVFQAVNPIFILAFGLLLTWLWGYLAARGREPNAAIKFAFGLLQLGLGFIILWWGAQTCDTRGMVGLSWLLLGYLLHTTGELCLSPVGLSQMTKLSPARLVSTVMGAWFLASAFSNLLAGVIAQFTGVTHGGDGGKVIPLPTETVNVYGDVFWNIGIAGLVSATVCFLLSPILSRWMHRDVIGEPG